MPRHLRRVIDFITLRRPVIIACHLLAEVRAGRFKDAIHFDDYHC